MKKALHWGRNENHQFWESEDRELLILCNHHESFWTAHRNYGFLFSCESAEEGANKVNAELCRERIWARQSDRKFSLVAANQVSLQDTLIPPAPDTGKPA